MTKLILKLNTAFCNSGIDAKGKAYAFVKVQATAENGQQVGVNINPTEWDAIASTCNIFDKVEVTVERVEADANGRTNSRGEVYQNGVNPDWSAAVITKSPFAGPCPTFATLAKNEAARQTAVRAQPIANAEDDI